MKIIECRTNHLISPIGYHMDKPVFSWQTAEAVGTRQTEARIMVFGDEKREKVVFDSGFIPEARSLGYEADFKMERRTRYHWEVTVRTDAGEEGRSGLNWFETGKCGEPWEGKWITCKDHGGRHPVFMKKIIIDRKVKNARLYICGLGLYEAYLNEKKISEECLTPYCNDYDKWLQYQTYDVTEEMRYGGRLKVLLGNGWYKGRFGFSSKLNKKPFYSDTWKLIAELRIEYEDGSTSVIGTDEDWLVDYSFITDSSIYDGEVWDMTLKNVPVKTICSAELYKDSMAPLMERFSTPVKVREKRMPIDMIHTPAGERVLDLGQNLVGTFSLHVREPRSKRIRLQFGEILQNGNFYRDNLRSAKAEFVYISDGEERTVTPHFTYYGYRYVKVEGIEDLKKEDFTALVLYSDIPQRGKLKTGQPLVNRLIENTEWGMKGNFIDVPTDCPQRDERMGWTGDAQVFSPTACFLRDCFGFYRKYLFDIWKEQDEQGGAVPNVIPSVGNKGTSSAWGDAACIIPWNLYLFYGDQTILRDQFESMKAWVDYVERIDGENHGWRDVFHFGDWLALDNTVGGVDQSMGATNTGFIADLYYSNSARITAKTAKILGKQKEAEHYDRLADRIMSDIQEEYYSPTGRCCIDTQTAHLLTLYFNVLPDKKRTRDALLKKLKESGYRLQTGFIGTPFLCSQLSEAGLGNLAYRLLLNEEYPGWLYEVKMGATTIWERWNSVLPDGSISSSGMNSLNHYAYGSIVEWLFRYGAGINPVEEEPGFKKVLIKPQVSWKLGFLEAEYDSPSGLYKSSWRAIDEEHLEIHVTVPFDCKAMVELPFVEKTILKSKAFIMGETQSSEKINPFFRDVRDGICYLEQGEYSVSYKTCTSLRFRYSIDTPFGELMENPEIRKILREWMPWVNKIPGYEWEQTLKNHADRYGGGVTAEELEACNKVLFEID